MVYGFYKDRLISKVGRVRSRNIRLQFTDGKVSTAVFIFLRYLKRGSVDFLGVNYYLAFATDAIEVTVPLHELAVTS